MTKQRNMKLGETVETRIAALAKLWSPVKPLTASDVVRECVNRVYIQETKKQEKRR